MANAQAQAPVSGERPPLIIKSTIGSELYKFYCSSCHGHDARGRDASSAQGPGAPDLTMLARRNGGVFPHDRVLTIITHGADSPTSHGGTGMPVWGAIFRALEPTEALVDIRVANLVQYLQSLQDTHVGRASLDGAGQRRSPERATGQ
jgi:mono/diheme cytochrome c family protein